MSSLSLSMVQPDGSNSMLLPLTQKPVSLGSSSGCDMVVISKTQSGRKHKVSLETTAEKNGKVLFRDCLNTASSPKTLGVNDEFSLSGNQFRVVKTKKSNISFQENTPLAKQRMALNRKATPFVFAKPAVVGFSTPPAAQSAENKPKMRLDTPHGNGNLKQQLAHVSASRDVLPASVRGFMASRVKKPAEKSVRPFAFVHNATREIHGAPAAVATAAAPREIKMAPTPLRKEIQQEGARLAQKREELLAELDEFGLDVDTYELWPVYALEQRVEGLREEQIRAGVEALLVESGHAPQDFVQYSTEEIESWLERELNRKPAVTFQGKLTEFASFISESDDEEEEHQEEEEEESAMPTESVSMETPQKNVAVESTTTTLQVEKVATPHHVEEVVVSATPQKVEDFVVHTTPKSSFKTPSKAALVTPGTMTCDMIRTELKKRGLKVGGLKSVIAERLAQALQAEEEEEMMEETGHAFCGQAVERMFESGLSKGTVVAWMPSDNEKLMRFKIVHDDGDDEILDFAETKAALVNTH